MPDPITTVTALSTAVKNVADVTTSMISSRKQNRLVAKGEIMRLEAYIQRVIYLTRMNAVRDLMGSAQANLIKSYENVKGYINSPIGGLLLETVNEEANAYRSYIDDFVHMWLGSGPR